MRWIGFCLFALACGDDDVGIDASVDAHADVMFDTSLDAAEDASRDSGFDSAVDSSVDSSVDATMVDEDCATDIDEDGNGYGGCADPICWDETRCIDAELAENALAGWAPCGDPVELDEEATTNFCEAGTPFPTERDFDCGTIRLEVYCEPDEGPGRALRYSVAMDLTPFDETLGPMSGRHTSFMAELGFLGTLYMAHGGGASGSEDPRPVRELWLGHAHHARAWVEAQTGTQVIVLLGASSSTTTFTVLEDGGVNASTSDPAFFLTAGLDALL